MGHPTLLHDSLKVIINTSFKHISTNDTLGCYMLRFLKDQQQEIYKNF